ncbi:MAG: barstar family protein [Chitinophagaceae bacterium]|nr:barstar family protein [Chitinophagaceae bacterium]MBK9533078.1 barstar family protein [Chitinophagaceae bacterium]
MRKISIDLSQIKSYEQLQDILQEKFEFPDFYGKNWNAFWDAITGLIEMPEKVEIIGWEYFSAAFPEDSILLLKCLEEYNKQPDLKSFEILIK